MRPNDNYEVLLRRSSECELLAHVARDISIRNKCAELAVEYRALANQMKERDLPAFETRSVAEGFEPNKFRTGRPANDFEKS